MSDGPVTEDGKRLSLIDELKAEHPWVWRRAVWHDRWERFVGRWLPMLCAHRTSVGPVNGPHTCLDCGRGVS